MKKNISIIEIAKLSGVSKSTVSRVLNNCTNVSEKTKQKVMEVAKSMHYQVNVSARSLRIKENRTIGVMLSKEWINQIMISPGHTSKLSGILNGIEKYGYDLLLFEVDCSDEDHIVEIIRNKGLAGLLLLDRVAVSTLEILKHYSVPSVLVNWSVPGYEKQSFVQTDIKSAIQMAVDCFFQKGYQDICMIDWPESESSSKNTEAYFRAAMKQNGLDNQGSILRRAFKVSWKELGHTLDKKRAQAYFCLSYHASMALIQYCQKRQIKIPQELAVLSFDYFHFFDYASVPLSGIAQDFEQIGTRAVDVLHDLIKNPSSFIQQTIPPKLILKKSM